MDNKTQQIEIAERLQLKVLELFEERVKDKTITAAELAVLVRLMLASGWNIDPARIPKGLRGVLTQTISAAEFEDDDADVIGKIAS